MSPVEFVPQKIVPLVLNLFFTQELKNQLKSSSKIDDLDFKKALQQLEKDIDEKSPIAKNLKTVETFLEEQHTKKKNKTAVVPNEFLRNIYLVLNGYIEVNNLFFNLIKKENQSVKNYKDLTQLVIHQRYEQLNQILVKNSPLTDYDSLITLRVNNILQKGLSLKDTANLEYELDNLIKNQFHVLAIQRKPDQEPIVKNLWIFLRTTPIYHRIFAYFINNLDAKQNASTPQKGPTPQKKVLTKEPPVKGKPKKTKKK